MYPLKYPQLWKVIWKELSHVIHHVTIVTAPVSFIDYEPKTRVKSSSHVCAGHTHESETIGFVSSIDKWEITHVYQAYVPAE
ncbi:hypothetical protein SAMN04489737_0457 [Arcanobacterium phocae]|uniref:Uncharacterized protein n=1 Tax=Arcanobacterium phocae TaxID=131112 RepID=A0A1H2LCT7_9ACTO|nr:hypothetical protein SAMN04489737_0457 [Arcanobacterium phocae]